MNALSQISQITQLAVELGAGCEHHLQACIDALREHQRIIKSMKEEEEEERLRKEEEAKKPKVVKKLKKPKYVIMAECEDCGEKSRKDDLVEWEETLYCYDCFHETYVRCEMCSEPFNREEGEYVVVSHDQPFRKREKTYSLTEDICCLECLENNLEEAYRPEFKTDKFEIKPAGGLQNDDISSYAERHAEMVAEMKWCLRCDLCPQDDNKNEKKWCSECYFQHGAEDDEEDLKGLCYTF